MEKGRLENSQGIQTVPLKNSVFTRYIRLVVLNDYSGKGLATLSEFSVLPAK